VQDDCFLFCIKHIMLWLCCDNCDTSVIRLLWTYWGASLAF